MARGEPAGWRSAARNFFGDRAGALRGPPSFEDHCWVSGRDPRLWSDGELYAELIESILEQTEIEPRHRVLEVGCASGFLARGVAPRCARYVGIDVATETLDVARRLDLPNATFRTEDATETSFESGTFDRAFSYDVFTNFAELEVAESVVREMLRVTRPGGHVLVGSLPDRERADEAAARAVALDRELTERSGPAPARPEPGARGWWSRVRRRLLAERAQILCYDFVRTDFLRLGEKLGVPTRILDIHPSNPYHGCRFNVRFTKPT